AAGGPATRARGPLQGDVRRRPRTLNLRAVLMITAIGYWISSVACVRIECGIVRSRTRAVFRLTTRSNFVGCSIGRSPGLAPFRILSTWVAERRYESTMSGPRDSRLPDIAISLFSPIVGNRYLSAR